jgi:hypothetical protein
MATGAVHGQEKIAQGDMRWALWPIVALMGTLLLVIFVTELTLWLLRQLGYL